MHRSCAAKIKRNKGYASLKSREMKLHKTEERNSNNCINAQKNEQRF